MASSTLNNLTGAAPAATSLFYHVASPFGSGDDRKATGTQLRQGLAVPWAVYKQGLPMLVPCTGTTTAGGAFTLGTALSASYFPAACYCYFPAGTTDAGDPAGWYYCTMSSTTVGQMYRNSYTPSSTPPAIPGSPTAPTGATNWTGVTSAVTAVAFSVPANALGANGSLQISQFNCTQTSNANAKSLSITFGAFTALSTTGGSLASSTQQGFTIFKISNTGATNAQVSYGANTAGTMISPLSGTVDTTSAVTVSMILTHGTATDNLMLLPFVAQITSDGA